MNKGVAFFTPTVFLILRRGALLSKKNLNPKSISRQPRPDFGAILDELIEKVFTVSTRADEAERNHEKAIVTHFLQTKGSRFSRTFEHQANVILDGWMNALDLSSNAKSKVVNELREYVGFAPLRPPVKSSFTFIDLFAGIGGFRSAMQELGGKCVFTSEWDKFAKETYTANFGEVPFGDITSPKTKELIPEGFDILCAGFPCQAFSIAGKRGGLEDTRGTLFFDVADILDKRRPKAFFLENVKGLVSHKSGDKQTLSIILKTLRSLGYTVQTPQIINAKRFGVPQNRERIFIVGFREDLPISETSFSYPSGTDPEITIGNILEQNVDSKFFLSQTALDGLKRHRARHESKGNGFGYEVLGPDDIAGAIVVGGMGRERNLYKDKLPKRQTFSTKKSGGLNSEGIRTLTPREWARLQGFPEEFIIDAVSDAQAYKQFGNSVAVPAIKATAKELLKALKIKIKT